MNREQILALLIGQDIDGLVAEKVFGLRIDERKSGQWTVWDKDGKWDWLKRYSTDISAAWEVVEKVGENKFNVEVMRRSDGTWFVTIKKVGGIDLKPSERIEVQAKGNSAPEAICKAALLAVIDK